METSTANSDKTIAAFIHLSTFSKYFIPLGNFVIPLLLWTAKQKDPFVDHHGRQALNFQISVFLYFIFLVFLGIAGIIYLGVEMDLRDPEALADNFGKLYQLAHALPILIFLGVIGTLLLALFILEIIAVITATVKASEGALYKYPFTINFITPTPVGQHQSKNDQFNNTQNQRL